MKNSSDSLTVLKRNWFFVVLVFVFIIALITQIDNKHTGNDAKSDTFKVSYAGGYQLRSNDLPASEWNELFVLAPNGTAAWKWLDLSTGNPTVKSEKSGVWYASSKIITVRIEGTSGPITTNFTHDGTYFRNGSKYLFKVN